ncbi:MAG TPA: cytochrome c [Acidobacteriota bacterium]|nr:cytochrome c [Acidobacteriota bacterium]
MILIRRVFLCFTILLWIGCRSGNPEKGKVLFDSRGCSYCHSIGKGKIQGPDLKNVTVRYNKNDLRKWLADPETIYKEVGRRPLNPGYSPMPRVVLTEEEIHDLVAFLSVDHE